MTVKSVVECRWGILGCGPEAATFVAELQAQQEAAGKSTPPVRHIIVAVSSTSASTSRAFADSHIHASSSTTTTATTSVTTTSSSSPIEAFGTSTELHAHPSIDSIFVASPQSARYQEALSALRGGKSVLISKPLAISSTEARELCDLAARRDKDKVKWLGFIMRSGVGQISLRAAADECAVGRQQMREQSPLLPWTHSLAVLEALDEVRDAGAMRLPSEDSTTTSFPKMVVGDDSSSSVISSPLEQRRRISVDASRRPGSRASMSSDAAQDDHSSGSMLRSQIHELKHVLRQKNALITSLEGRAGSQPVRPKVAGRSSLPAQANGGQSGGSHAMQGHRRTSSLDRSSRVASSSDDEMVLSPPSIHMPLSDVINTLDNDRPDSPGSLAVGTRRRKDANGGGRRSITPDRSNSSSNNSLGLSTVREGNSSNLMLGEGFLAPTIASENRRMATTGASGSPRTGTPNGISGLGSPILSPGGGGGGGGGGGKGTSKVIDSLSNELNSARIALEDAKVQLRTGQRSISTLQRTLDETKETLGRSRTENERLAQMMARKERQIQEALERARKAEVESKELGKSSREWGVRVRNIEAELGQERILKQRAEVQYEAISATWKQIREAWEKEMAELRESQGDAVKRNREEVQSILAKFKAAEESWRGREEEGRVLAGIIKQLEAERNRATAFVEGPVKELMAQLAQHEQHTGSQDAAVKAVQEELQRIMRLMRSTPASS